MIIKKNQNKRKNIGEINKMNWKKESENLIKNILN